MPHPDRRRLGSLTLDELADEMASAQVGSPASSIFLAEVARRQTKAQRDNARYMLASVVVLALASVVSAVFAYLAWAYPHSA